jgi:hypothetical protein
VKRSTSAARRLLAVSTWVYAMKDADINSTAVVESPFLLATALQLTYNERNVIGRQPDFAVRQATPIAVSSSTTSRSMRVLGG